MKPYIQKQPKHVRERIEAKLDDRLVAKLEKYCQYLDSDRDYVISQALEIAFRKDLGFLDWLAAESAAPEGTPGDAVIPPLSRKKARPGGSIRRQRRCCARGIRRSSAFQRPAVRGFMAYRNFINAALAAAVGSLGLHRIPFPEANPLLQLVFLHVPYLLQSIKCAYLAMLFTTPYIALSVAGSLAYIFVLRQENNTDLARLPAYPDAAGRDRLFLIVGELHHPRRTEPVPSPRWLIIPERGLYTGIIVIGAIGSGKTTGCMVPFAEQILSYHAADKDRRVGGLVLEVKGDFCHKVSEILEKHGRGRRLYRDQPPYPVPVQSAAQ